VRPIFLFCAVFLTGCQILSGLSDYEASEVTPPPIEAEPFGRRFGGPGFESIAGAGITPDGSIVIGGTMANVDFGSGPLVTYGEFDPFLAKFDGRGNHLASDSFGAPDGEVVLDIAVGSDGRVAAVGLFVSSLSFGTIELVDPSGDTEVSGFVAVFDASLEPQWAIALPAFNRYVRMNVAFGPTGEVVVAGGFSGTVDFLDEVLTSSSDHDAFVLGLTASGAKRWLKHVPSSGLVPLNLQSFRGPTGLATDATGNSYVAIPHYSAMTFATATGTDDIAGNVALLKLDPNGGEAWVRIYGSPNRPQVPSTLTVDRTGRPVIAGLFNGDYAVDDFSADGSAIANIDLFISRFNVDGAHLGSTIFPGAQISADQETSYIASLEATPDGGFVGAGTLFDRLTIGATTLQNTSATPNFDILVFRLDPGLEPTLARRYGDSNVDVARWAGQHPSGHIVVTGQFFGQLRFGPYDFTSAGEADIFLVQYDP
jgi:hypothetical protein